MAQVVKVQLVLTNDVLRLKVYTERSLDRAQGKGREVNFNRKFREIAKQVFNSEAFGLVDKEGLFSIGDDEEQLDPLGSVCSAGDAVTIVVHAAGHPTSDLYSGYGRDWQNGSGLWAAVVPEGLRVPVSVPLQDLKAALATNSLNGSDPSYSGVF